MNRPGFERTKRRAHIRLSLEHLECRRLMAGLNVLVFNDQDGSRSLSGAMDTPAANRLVYVDLNRNLGFDQGEPLAVSDINGVANFANLPMGDYLIGLAANHAAQVLTTSVVPDAQASSVSATNSRAIIGSSNLGHAWALSTDGVLTPVGTLDQDRTTLDLGGEVVSYIGGGPMEDGAGATTSSMASGTGSDSGWVLVNRGGVHPALVQLDFNSGVAKSFTLQGVSAAQRVTSLVRVGSSIYAQLQSGSTSSIAQLTVSPSQASLGVPIVVPEGRLINSTVDNRLAILASGSGLAGEGDDSPASRIISVQLVGSVATTESLQLDHAISDLSYSADGKYLFASGASGGLEVYATTGGLQMAAILADATGPVASTSRDGRVVTGSTARVDELIVWDVQTWTPMGHVELPGLDQPLTSLSVDRFGERVLATTTAGVFAAALANPAPQPVQVTDGEVPAQTRIGIRLTSKVDPLPTRINLNESTYEDVPLEYDLTDSAAVRALGAGPLFFMYGAGAQIGNMSVSSEGRLTYRTEANVNGAEDATVRVYDGVTMTTLVISLNITPVNDAPIAMTIDPVEIAEAAAAGQLAGLATVFDVDSDARYIITTSDPRFVVVDGQLTLAADAELDFETEPVIELELTATDLDNPAFVITQHISLPIANSNDAPTRVDIDLSDIDENASAIAVGQLGVTDPDQNGEYVYSVSDSRFEVIDGQLRLRSGAVLDHEGESQVPVVVTVTDPTAEGRTQSVSSTITLNVVDRNDAPTGFTLSASKVNANEAGAVVGTISVVDQDRGDEFTYQVSDPRFTVDGNVLRLKEGEVVAHETATMLTVLVTVADAAGAVVSETVTIDVVNHKPFQNPRNPLDVDNDGFVYPRDVLILVNRLNRKGAHILTPVSGEGDAPVENYYYDVNGDGMLTPMDVLIIVNFINKGSTVSGEAQSSGSDTKLPESDDVVSSPLDGEGESDEELVCLPWAAPQISSHEESLRLEREAIDAELESLVEQLSLNFVRHGHA